MTKLKDLFGQHHGLDERSVEALVKALERKNLPGFDYLEFKQSIYALQHMGMDDPTKFRSAFATASVMGLSKEKLLQTAQHYKKVLQEEKSHFDRSMQNHLQERVENKRREVEVLKKKVEEYRQKIQQLEAQIELSNQTIDQADSSIEDAKEKIEAARTNFEFTLNSIVNEIDNDIDHIEQYL